MGLFSENQIITDIIANIAFSLEILAVVVIMIAILAAITRYISDLFKHYQPELRISDFKHSVGRGVQVALELLIAADIINTVILDATIQNVIVLGVLVLIRTFLSWTLILESEGHLPWWNRSNDQHTS